MIRRALRGFEPIKEAVVASITENYHRTVYKDKEILRIYQREPVKGLRWVQEHGCILVEVTKPSQLGSVENLERSIERESKKGSG
jgi:hypothetical protein